MNRKKCKICKEFTFENSVSYYKRTKDPKNPLPYLCKDCLKIQRKQNPTEKDIKNREKEAIRRNKKRNLRLQFVEFNKKVNTCHFLLEQRNRLNEQRKIYWKIQGALIRSKRAKALIDISNQEKTLIKEFYEKCPLNFHVDHIIPISKGGKHCIKNLQYLPAKDNLTKNKKITTQDLIKFMDDGKITIDSLQVRFQLSIDSAKKIMAEISKN